MAALLFSRFPKAQLGSTSTAESASASEYGSPLMRDKNLPTSSLTDTSSTSITIQLTENDVHTKLLKSLVFNEAI